MTRLLVTGASSVVGDYLLPRLEAEGVQVTAFSRSPRVGQGAAWRQADVAREPLRNLVSSADALVHLAPLPLIVPVLPGLPESVSRIVALGTTSVFTKAEARADVDRRLADQQLRAEEALRGHCERRGLHYTLLRPTLVYDGRRDKNVTRIAGFIRRLGFFPMAAPGKGLRQPLHADDLAAAVYAALEQEGGSRSYNLAGGETLSYRAMLERIFRALGRRPRILPVPVGMYRAAIAVARLHPRFRSLSLDVADRMNQNLVFDFSDAARDLGFYPRGFEPEFPR
ncbi:MAG: NAD-dependent epimerase/dehydratase family protein [Bacillota bacterium]